RPVIGVIMATIGLAAVLRGFGPLVWGAATKALPLPIPDAPIVLGPLLIPPIQVVGAATSLVFLAAFGWFFLRSRAGIAMRAVAGGLIVGVVENVAAGYLDPYVGGGTKDFAPYLLMIAALMIRPYGIFGKEIIERV